MSVSRVAAALTVVACVVAGVTGCTKAKDEPGGGPTGASTSAAGSAAPFEGAWTGTWTRLTPVSGGGTLTLELHQQGAAITGTLTSTGGACLLAGPVTGTATGTSITFKISDATGAREFAGDLTGTKISGTINTHCAAGTGTGTWEVTNSSGGGGGAAAGIPADVCGLLTTEQVATVVRGDIKVTNDPARTNSGVTNAGCTWDSLGDKLTLTFVAGIPKGQADLSLQARAHDNNGQAVAGLGDRAFVFSSIPADAEVDALIGDLYMTLELIRTGADGQHDQVVALARAIAARL